MSLTVRTLFFASYRDLAGASELPVELPVGARVADLVAELRSRGGGLADLPDDPAVAVNQEYSAASRELHADDEVALIPPVAGG